MNLELDEAQQILRETFTDLLARECPTSHVRACEATGFSADLWVRTHSDVVTTSGRATFSWGDG